MNCVEIIHLRTASRTADALAKQIRRAIAAEASDDEKVSVYRRCGLGTDIAIHISYRRNGGAESPCVLGFHLASALSAYGLVKHTLWEELK